MEDVERRVSACLMRVRSLHPFFGALTLFAEISFDPNVPTAATDGRNMWLNPAFVRTLVDVELAGLLVHEILHMALEHVLRRRERDAYAWNVAADIVVNGMIEASTDYRLPKGAVRYPKLAHLSVEEVFEQITSHLPRLPKLTLVDIKIEANDASDLADRATVDPNYWKFALQQASTIATLSGKQSGSFGLGDHREFDACVAPQISWRELLWRFLVITPNDYAGFDRRFVWQGMYLDQICGESADIAVAIDTSGSVDAKALGEFMAELQGIMAAYPALNIILYFADADLYGPYSIDAELPLARGGGGTSFIPFFCAIDEAPPALAVYFTDGFAEFPLLPPNCDVLWVISIGGLETNSLPFGDVIRLGLGE